MGTFPGRRPLRCHDPHLSHAVTGLPLGTPTILMNRIYNHLALTALAPGLALFIPSALYAQGGVPAYAPPAFFATGAAPIAPPPAGVTPPTIFVQGDVNNDGMTDFVHLNVTPAPDVLFSQLRTAVGGYAPVPTVLGGFAALSEIALGDLNMDGRLDVALLSLPAGGFYCNAGTGIGTFPPTVLVPVPLAGGAPLSFSISEVNGDGVPDILVLVNNPGGAAAPDWIQPMVGLGAFAFAAPAPSGIGVGAMEFKPADLDNNGLQDLVTLRTVPTNDYFIHAQVAPATWVPGPMPVVPIPGAAPATTTFEVADINSDDNFDLITLRPAAGITLTHLQVAPGIFGAPAGSVAPPPAGLSPNFLVADFNGDCVQDICYINGPAGVLTLQQGNNAGAFVGAFIPVAIGVPSFWPLTADFDSDGTMDLAAIQTAGADGVNVLINTQPDPANVSPFGSGTAGKSGRLGMLTNGPPVNGTPNFGFTSTNAPPYSLGVLFITDSPDLVGSDPFGVGANFFIDFFAATTIYVFDMHSGPTGSAQEVTGIPANPLLIGLSFYAESFWVWPAYDAYFRPPFSACTSRAIKLTIL